MNRKDVIFWTVLLLCVAAAVFYQLQRTSKPEALLRAAVTGDTAAVIALLDEGVELNVKDEWNGTPMMYAAAYGHTDIVNILLARDANVNAPSRLGRTPLMWAARHGHNETVQLLANQGADLSVRDQEGNTALDLGSCVKLLL